MAYNANLLEWCADLFDLGFLSPHVRLEVVIVHDVDGHRHVSLRGLPHLFTTTTHAPCQSDATDNKNRHQRDETIVFRWERVVKGEISWSSS